MTPEIRKCRIGIVGLGYVGLPLAVEFGMHYETVGFDVKAERIAQLRRGRDVTLEATRAELAAARRSTGSRASARSRQVRRRRSPTSSTGSTAPS
jgi:UDP-N-acetyl-D-galactosamine dehydrogenase